MRNNNNNNESLYTPPIPEIAMLRDGTSVNLNELLDAARAVSREYIQTNADWHKVYFGEIKIDPEKTWTRPQCPK